MPIIQPTPIDQLPQPPNPADRSNFNSLAYPFTAAMLPLTVQINKAISDMYNNALEVEALAGEAGGSATAAAGSATAANAAKTGAETAKAGAETARNGAQSSATAAAGSATAANTAKVGAEAARNSAAASATAAAQSAAEAAQSASGAIAPSIHAATAKATPADADEFPIVDSAASWSLKKLTWGNLKAAVFAAFKVIATGGSAKATLGLGTAATRDVGTGEGQVLGSSSEDNFGLAGRTFPTGDNRNVAGFLNTVLTQRFASGAAHLEFESDPNWFNGYVVGSGSDTFSSFKSGILMSNSDHKISFFYGVRSTDTELPNIVHLHHTGNILTTTGQSTLYPMTQKAVTDAINAAVANVDVSGPRPVKDHGAVATAGSQTVVCNVQESDFHIMSMETANTTGTLTIDFANMPNTVGKHFSWHVRLRRGGRKTVAFAQTVTWAGGVAPSFGTGTRSHDLIMFYKVDNETIRGMVVDAW